MIFNNLISPLKKSLAVHHRNLKGWRTNRKIIVIESDDWGSIRMPSKEVYNKLLKGGIRVDRCPYNRNDSLASEDDLAALFDVLLKYKDKNGNHPVITANTVVANPDFEKIKASGFEKYYYEPFTETLRKYPAHVNTFQLWQEGMDKRIFHPQFHGREHVNIPLWLQLLKNNHTVFRKAFESRMWGLGPSVINTGKKINIQAAFDAYTVSEIENQKQIIREGLQLFKEIFGYPSKSFIANNFIWDKSLNHILKENGVDILQGMKYQKLPLLDKEKHPLIRHYMGEIIDEQTYLVRNCRFEPTQFPQIDSVNSCLNDISTAFFWKKPAIINSHRLNFIGFINRENRNLASFKQLLLKILKKWPEVEFMTSADLGQLIINQKISQK